MAYNPVLDSMRRRQELLDEESKMTTPKREIPKNAVALVITKEPGEGEDDYMLDLQVLAPETEDEDGYLVSIANLAANLLENAMFGDEDDEEELELDSDFFGSIDLGED
jgi:hypothetical protein